MVIGSLAVASLPGRAMMAMNLGRSEVFDAVNRNDDVSLPVVILLNDSDRREEMKEFDEQGS